MKHVLLLLLTFVLGSCVTYGPVTNYVDYSAYVKNGMFLTESNSVSFEYQPKGSIQVLLYNGYLPKSEAKEQTKSKMKEDGIYYQNTAMSSKFKNATLYEALDMAVKIAEENGANGIINLRYEYLPVIKSSPGGWQITGMAIQK